MLIRESIVLIIVSVMRQLLFDTVEFFAPTWKTFENIPEMIQIIQLGFNSLDDSSYLIRLKFKPFTDIVV